LLTAPADPAALGGRAKRVIAADKVTKGWDAVNPEAQRALRQQIQQQTKGLTPATAPAHAVAAADLKFVPKKADPNAKPAVAAAVTSTGETHDKPAKNPRPESAVAQPGNVPPTTAGGAPLKPFNASNEPEPKPKSQTFTTVPKGPTTPEAQERAAQERQAETAAPLRGIPKTQTEDVRRRGEETEALRGVPPRGNAPAVSPRPGAKNSKDSKDKDKDKNGGN